MTLFKRLLSEIKVAKAAFATGIGLLLLATAAGQIAPLLLKQLIDHYLTPLAKGKSIVLANFEQLSWLYLALIIGSALLSYVSYRSLVYSSNKVVTKLRKQAFDVMQRLPILRQSVVADHHQHGSSYLYLWGNDLPGS